MPDAAAPSPSPYAGPTPAYVYDLAEVRASLDRLRSALPQPSRIYYSLKANPHPRIVGALHAGGCRAEVSSVGEVQAALDAGVPPGDVLYSGPGKSDRDLDTAFTAGVRHFSLDSARAARQLDDAAARHGTTARFLLRVNTDLPAPGAGLAMTGVSSPFGADRAGVEAAPEAFTGHDHLDFDGLHLYLATNLSDEDALLEQFDVALATARRLQDAMGVPLRVLDLGGGFGAPYARAGELPHFPALAGRLAARLDETFPQWREGDPLLAFESGRYLAATCGTLYTRVLDAKSSHGQRVLVLDSGIHHLGGMSGLRRVPPIRPQTQQVHPAPDPSPDAPDAGNAPDAGDAAPVMVCGPLCTPLDTWARSAPALPAGPGDLLAVPNVGAYGLQASLVLFLGHPLPLEVVRDGDAHVSTTRLETRRRTLPAAA
ncbi:alanine racemase [Streptomyces sp. TRM 70351]|uniref:alanine racemase n=1 Tax=Streptomyces sp. TRM 70351 TaxID=3116552 RepID=UPI002E7B80DA|nr:alanine racemase [Streptomyces sp. TRM 70351]MEE1927854.1 alanine racemase [Streptomyces sp. TRM 70351]